MPGEAGELLGAEAVRADLPTPPQMDEPPLSTLPPLPEDPKDFAQWARSLAELSEQRGRQEGRTEGKTDTLRENILLVLRARGVAVPPELEQAIRTCSDAATLAAWLERAAIVVRADQVLTG